MAEFSGATLLRKLHIPETTLARTRWVFLVFASFEALLLTPLLAAFADTDGHPLAAFAAGALMTVLWVRAYRDQRLNWFNDLIEAVCLTVAAVSTGNPIKAVGMFYMAIHYRSVVRPIPSVIVGVPLYVGALALALQLRPESLRALSLPQTVILQIVQASMISGIGALLAHSLQHLERVKVRDAALLQAGTEMLSATDQSGIYAATLRAIPAITGEADAPTFLAALGPEAIALAAPLEQGGAVNVLPVGLDEQVRARLLLGKTVELKMDDYPHLNRALKLQDRFRHLFMIPVMLRGEFFGALATARSQPFSRDISRTLETLAAHVALALESTALSEQLGRRQSEDRFRSLVQNSSDVIAVISPSGTITYMSPSSKRVFGQDASLLVGRSLKELIHPEDAVRFLDALDRQTRLATGGALIEARWRQCDGSWQHLETAVSNLLFDPNVQGVVLNSRDITERKALEERLVHEAFHDALTGLANRALFTNRVRHAFTRLNGEGEDEGCHVLFLDLDGFKTINDSLGHAVGDQLLTAVADRILGCVGPADTAARLGGDEFAILLEGCDESRANAVAQCMIDKLQTPFQLPGVEVKVQGSVGIASTSHADSGDDLLRNADVAMYVAKSRGKGRCAVYEASMHAVVIDRMELEVDLQRAIDQGALEVHYQPIVSLETGRILGVEALVRWNHPQRGMMSPVQFVPLAEETGLIVPLGRWILRQCCLQVRAWQERYPELAALSVNVNVSARQLQGQGLDEHVREALSESGLNPSSLVLELTESVWMQGEDVINRLKALKALGVRLAIDDFGTGYSSLGYLRSLPVDIVKIDKFFVDGLSEGAEGTAIVRAIVEMVRTLRLETIAEGVETPSQVAELARLSCDMGQGYLFTRPVPAARIDALLSDNPSRNLLTQEASD